MPTDPENRRKVQALLSKAWEITGITKHLGGIQATESLARLCKVTRGQRILDIGCGTGYTACHLAKRYGATVVGLDRGPRLLKRAKERAIREGVSEKVTFVRADAHSLPFRNDVFNTVLAESVLIFCDQGRVSREAYRALKDNGIFGCNEVTFFKPPPAELLDLLSRFKACPGPQPLLESDWDRIFSEAGFSIISSSAHKIDFPSLFIDQVRVDGFKRFLAGMIRGLADPDIRTIFFNKDMRRARRKFISYAGYGLYVSEKPDEARAKER